MKVIKQIKLESSLLDCSLKSHILSKAKKLFENKYDKEHGYVIDIKSIDILSNKVSDIDSGVNFTVSLDLDVLNPKVGQEYTATVSKVFTKTFFVLVKNVIKVMIPLDKTDEKTAGKTADKDKSKPVVGKQVNIIIKSVNYSEGAYTYIGTLKEDKGSLKKDKGIKGAK